MITENVLKMNVWFYSAMIGQRDADGMANSIALDQHTCMFFVIFSKGNNLCKSLFTKGNNLCKSIFTKGNKLCDIHSCLLL